MEQKEIVYWEKRASMVALKKLKLTYEELKGQGFIIPDVVLDKLQEQLDEITF